MTVHDAIPKRKRLIGQFHLVYVKNRFGGFLLLEGQKDECKRLARTVLIFTEKSDQLSRATDRVPGLPASPGYAQ